MMRKIALEAITDTFLIALPLDILYLYIKGGWYEPIKAVLWFELFLLSAVSLLGFWRIVRFAKEERERREGYDSKRSIDVLKVKNEEESANNKEGI